MTASKPWIELDANEWKDVAALASVSGVESRLQYHGVYQSDIVWGGAAKPDGTLSHDTLYPRDSVQGSAANIWVRGYGRLSVVEV